jgi:peptidoglycan/LPS O-acetylase OafA/YrhL
MSLIPLATSKSELRALTSLRGFAAMAVVLQHFAATFQEYCRGNLPSPVPHGYMAVDFFFVLSGFIMCYTYLDDFQARGLAAYRPFLAKRFGRIFPLQAFCVLAILLLGFVSVSLIGRNIFHDSANLGLDVPANILMLQGIGIGHNLNGPSWSVSVEFVAYLLFPLLIAVVFRGWGWAMLLALLAWASLGYLAWIDPKGSLGATDPVSAITRCLAGFALGMIGYRVYAETRIGQLLGGSVVATGLGVAAGLALLLKQDLLAAILFCPIVIAFARNDGLPARLLNWRPLYFLGVISFSLYLVHDAFRPVALLLLQRLSPQPVSVPVAFGLTLLWSLLIIPFAWVTYAAIERPGRAYVRAAIEGVSRGAAGLARAAKPRAGQG